MGQRQGLRTGWLRAGWLRTAGLLSGAAVLAGAQTHKVAKPEQVVRAIGVYEWTGDLAKPTASRLVPVTVFIDGELHDAGEYLPQPVPFALEQGNEYEVEHAGVPQGLLRLDYARRLGTTNASTAPDSDLANAWFGYGTYKTETAAGKGPALRASRTQPAITSSHDDAGHPAPNGKTGDAGKGSADDADRPTMRRRPGGGGSSTGTPQTGGSTTGPGGSTTADKSPDTSDRESRPTAADDPDRPTLKRRPTEAEKKSKRDADAATVKPIGSLNDDPDRPTLHRGQAGDRSGAGGEVNPPQLVGVPSSIHQVAAVSDAATRPEHDFARPWSDPTERTAVLGQMQGLARAQLAAYNTTAGQQPGGAGAGSSEAGMKQAGSGAKAAARTGTGTHAATRTGSAARARSAKASASGAPAVALLEEQIQGYTLSYGAQPVYVYTAHTAGAGADLRYVTLVTEVGVGGESRVVLASVTDAAHLDRTPWMRFVDVVDAEASNRASLLFELRAASGRNFVIYRVLGNRADQLLATTVMP